VRPVNCSKAKSVLYFSSLIFIVPVFSVKEVEWEGKGEPTKSKAGPAITPVQVNPFPSWAFRYSFLFAFIPNAGIKSVVFLFSELQPNSLGMKPVDFVSSIYSFSFEEFWVEHSLWGLRRRNREQRRKKQLLYA